MVIEEITEETTISSDDFEKLSSKSSSFPQETCQSSSSQSASLAESQSSNNDYFKALKDDPESIRFVAVSFFWFAFFLLKL